MDKILELRQKRATLVKQARDILDKAEAEKRNLTAEEDQQYEATMTEVDAQGKQIERLERQVALEKELAQKQDPVAGGKEPPGGEPPDSRKMKPTETEEYRKAFVSFLRRDLHGLLPEEVRALQADADTAGGYLVAPQQFVNQLIKAVDDQVTIRPLATKFTLEKAESLGVPTLTADLSDADWTSEIDTGSEDNTMDFGKRELFPHPVAKLLKVSNKLLRSASVDVEALVRDRLAYKFAITHEKAFMSGSGSNQPLGVFVASANGISTSRDVSTGNTATAIGADGLIEAKYTLKPQYWRAARWIFHRDAVKQIRKLKDGNGQYLWQAGIAAGRQDTILDLPYLMSEFAPNTFTTGKYVGIVGDFSFYWIVDALDMQIQRLVELYARTNQVGFIGRLETDGAPTLEEAFVRVKLA